MSLLKWLGFSETPAPNYVYLDWDKVKTTEDFKLAFRILCPHIKFNLDDHPQLTYLVKDDDRS